MDCTPASSNVSRLAASYSFSSNSHPPFGSTHLFSVVCDEINKIEFSFITTHLQSKIPQNNIPNNKSRISMISLFLSTLSSFYKGYCTHKKSMQTNNEQLIGSPSLQSTNQLNLTRNSSFSSSSVGILLWGRLSSSLGRFSNVEYQETLWVCKERTNLGLVRKKQDNTQEDVDVASQHSA